MDPFLETELQAFVLKYPNIKKNKNKENPNIGVP